jgi:hypothetical protein
MKWTKIDKDDEGTWPPKNAEAVAAALALLAEVWR